MIFTCPECDARLQGEEPGVVVACHACANPVVVPAPPEEPEDDAALPDAPVPGRVRQRSPWATAGIVLAILAVAHVALYLLLTIEARSQLAAIEKEYDAGRLAEARKPDASPEPGTPDYRDWRDRFDRWIKAGEYRRHREHVTLLRTWTVFSFLVQVGIVGWILVKYMGRRPQPTA